MKIIKADVLGMCFGVRDALALIAEVKQPEHVTIHGELVHNEQVLERLAARGFHMVSESRRTALPMTDTVLITAHGVSAAERQRLQQAGKALVDTTCPLVTRAHQAAQKLQAEGCHVLVLGKRGHVEVQGIVGDLESYDVVQGPEEVRTYPYTRLGLMCQTTTPVRLAEEVRAAVADRNPHAEVHYIDTICLPTKEHQRALEELLGRVEVMVVVGGRNSNNTRQLVLRCQEQGIRAYHVQGPEDLQPAWFDGVGAVGLSAGTSTLDETIIAVQERLERIAVGEAVSSVY
jgi:4-hydroxy-3-methylbut-2-enyl diphosphate reductase